MESVLLLACPRCGEETAVAVAGDGAPERRVLRIEADCQVCCHPLHVTVALDPQSGPRCLEVGAGW